MLWKASVIALVFIVSSTATGQPVDDNAHSRKLLNELSDLLLSTPTTADGCQTVLADIRSWHSMKLSQLGATEASLSISAPEDNAHVPARPWIEGRVSDPTAEIIVVVHPMEVADYYVQPGITVKEDGTWKFKAYVGRPGRDIGKHFEVMVFANPETQLTEGSVLSGWPKAEWKSQVIEVVRD